MRGLFKRGEIWWYDITVASTRERRSTRTADRALAEDIKARREWELRRASVHGPETVLTFGRAVDLYTKQARDTRFLLPLYDRWRDALIKDITAGTIRQAAVDLYPDASAATRNRQAITPAQAVINFAADLDLCRHIRVKRFTEAKAQRRAVDHAWLAAFMAAASPRLAALALFMFTTGARIGESCTLTWSAVDLSAGKAGFPETKNGEAHDVYLTPAMVAALANLERTPGKGGGKVFGFATRHSVYRPWKAACAAAKIAYVAPHQAGRHSFATEMIVRAGVDVATTAKLGNWKSHRLLSETYVHPEGEQDTINAVFGTFTSQRKSK